MPRAASRPLSRRSCRTLGPNEPSHRSRSSHSLPRPACLRRSTRAQPLWRWWRTAAQPVEDCWRCGHPIRCAYLRGLVRTLLGSARGHRGSVSVAQNQIASLRCAGRPLAGVGHLARERPLLWRPAVSVHPWSPSLPKSIGKVRWNLTPPSSGRRKGRCAPFAPPLMSNVRQHESAVQCPSCKSSALVPGTLAFSGDDGWVTFFRPKGLRFFSVAKKNGHPCAWAGRHGLFALRSHMEFSRPRGASGIAGKQCQHRNSGKTEASWRGRGLVQIGGGVAQCGPSVYRRQRRLFRLAHQGRARRRLTAPSSGRAKGRFAPLAPPLMSNVRSHLRLVCASPVNSSEAAG